MVHSFMKKGKSAEKIIYGFNVKPLFVITDYVHKDVFIGPRDEVFLSFYEELLTHHLWCGLYTWIAEF